MTRTRDLLITNQLLYQLSYAGSKGVIPGRQATRRRAGRAMLARCENRGPQRPRTFSQWRRVVQ